MLTDPRQIPRPRKSRRGGRRRFNGPNFLYADIAGGRARSNSCSTAGMHEKLPGSPLFLERLQLRFAAYGRRSAACRCWCLGSGWYRFCGRARYSCGRAVHAHMRWRYVFLALAVGSPAAFCVWRRTARQIEQETQADVSLNQGWLPSVCCMWLGLFAVAFAAEALPPGGLETGCCCRRWSIAVRCRSICIRLDVLCAVGYAARFEAGFVRFLILAVRWVLHAAGGGSLRVCERIGSGPSHDLGRDLISSRYGNETSCDMGSR